MGPFRSTATTAALVLLATCMLAPSPTRSFDLFDPIRALYSSTMYLTNLIIGQDNNRGQREPQQQARVALQPSSNRRANSRDGHADLPHRSEDAKQKDVLTINQNWTKPAAQNDVSDLRARCFAAREPEFSKNPKLFFFSSQKHSPETRGCKVELEIELKKQQNNGQTPADYNNNVRAQLIHSGLYNPRYPTFFFVHGFLSDWNDDNWMCGTKDLILDRTLANVFIVDWSGGSKPRLPIDYGISVRNTEVVAERIAEFIGSLLAMSGQRDANQFHFVGHSLGAHISGFVGYSVNRLGYIIGMDPAGPCFGSEMDQRQQVRASWTGDLGEGRRRLSPAAANFVLALHTDTALFGLNENCGHYDVYVNGGYKQPYCGSTSLGRRFEDLMDLNFKDSLNPNIGCAHSFSHKIVDTLVGYVTRDGRKKARENQIKTLQVNKVGLETCYPMAYQCSDWAAFRSGECGFCLEGDSLCVYTGLTLLMEHPKKSSRPDRPLPFGTSKVGIEEIDDDDKFNDEEGDDEGDREGDKGGDKGGNGDNPTDTKPQNPEESSLIPNEKSSRNQHFMKASSNEESCMFHYQLVVATRKCAVDQVDDSQKYFYYLDIPLEQAGLLNDANGNRLHDRLVQVSHRIPQDSAAHNFLRITYLNSVRKQNPGFNSTDDQNLEFYTALITFRQAPPDQCKHGEIDGSDNVKKWQLCRPLNSIKEARLWSKNRQKLDAVEWVGMNYMSGLHLEDRVTNSWLFDRDLQEGLKSRDELQENVRAEIGDLSADQKSTAANFIKKPVSCLLSFLDSSDSGKASTNFKCNRSAKELKFSIKLNALKQTHAI